MIVCRLACITDGTCLHIESVRDNDAWMMTVSDCTCLHNYGMCEI